MLIIDKKNILFDLDGTLIDSKEGVTNSLKYAFDSLGITDIDYSDIHFMIGPPLYESFETILGSARKHLIIDAIKAFQNHYGAVGLFQNELYDGVKQLLKKLKEAGKNIYLVTAKPTVYAKIILEHRKIIGYFDGIIGNLLKGEREDKDFLISLAISRHMLNKAETIMVGDRKNDIIGARINDIDSIGVLYGYGSYDELIFAHAHNICIDIDNLSDMLLKPWTGVRYEI